MSRIAKQPVEIPNGVDVTIKDRLISFKGPKGEMTMDLHESVKINKNDIYQKDRRANIIIEITLI